MHACTHERTLTRLCAHSRACADTRTCTRIRARTACTRSLAHEHRAVSCLAQAAGANGGRRVAVGCSDVPATACAPDVAVGKARRTAEPWAAPGNLALRVGACAAPRLRVAWDGVLHRRATAAVQLGALRALCVGRAQPCQAAAVVGRRRLARSSRVDLAHQLAAPRGDHAWSRATAWSILRPRACTRLRQRRARTALQWGGVVTAPRLRVSSLAGSLALEVTVSGLDRARALHSQFSCTPLRVLHTSH